MANEHEKRPLKLGATDDTYIEVIDGVKVGDLVLRNPRAVLAEARLEAGEGDAEEGDDDSFGPPGDREAGPQGGPEANGAARQVARPPARVPPRDQVAVRLVSGDSIRCSLTPMAMESCPSKKHRSA